MGLIRSGYTTLTVEDDDELTALMWPIVREMIKTAIENEQHMVIEGCYLPFDWRKDFEPEYLQHIRFVCLVMTQGYIREHFADIRAFASVVENRDEEEGLRMEAVLADNAQMLEMCRRHGCEVILIDGEYRVELPC